MIKLLLKHMIIEQCLTTLFDNLHANFHPLPTIEIEFNHDSTLLNDVGVYVQYALPLIRRTSPALLSDNIISYDMLKGNIGICYAQRFLD